MKKFITCLLAAIIFLISSRTSAEDRLPEKFFPFGILHSINDNEFVDNDWRGALRRQAVDWSRHNINTACLYGMGVPPGKFSVTLDILGPHEIKVWGQMYMIKAYEPKNPGALVKTADFLKKHRDDPRILAYTIKDEPKEEHFDLYSSSVEFMKRYDDNHSIVSIFFRNESLRPYLNLLDTVCIDSYPIRCRTRDPWWIDYHAKELKDITDKNPFWYCLQAHSFYGTNYIDKSSKENFKDCDLPTPEEFKLMSWLAVANGGDGLIWFLYKWPSPWLEEIKGGGEGLVNMIEQPNPLWREIYKLGATLAPAGRIFSGSKTCKSKDIILFSPGKFKLPECKFSAKVMKTGRPRQELVTLHIRKHPERPERYVFVINNDVHRARKARLFVDRKKGEKLLDLISLKEAGDSKGNVRLRLAPGEGRMYLLSSEEILGSARNSILCERQRLLFRSVSARLQELVQAKVFAGKDTSAEYEKRLLACKVDEYSPDTFAELEKIQKQIEEKKFWDSDFVNCIKILDKAACRWSKLDKLMIERKLNLQYGRADKLKPYVGILGEWSRTYVRLHGELYGYFKSNDNVSAKVVRAEKLLEQIIPVGDKVGSLCRKIPADKTDLYLLK